MSDSVTGEVVANAMQELNDGSVMGSIFDSTGSIEVKVYYKDETGTVPSPHCGPDPSGDYVLVGGGAEILYQGQPGALLTRSYPDNNGEDYGWSWTGTWHAQSKDHYYGYTHTLRCIAFGLRVAGVSASDLRSLIQYRHGSKYVQSGYSGGVYTAPFDSGFRVIGGGAIAGYSGAGRLLTGVGPSGNGWYAVSKDHGVADSGTTEVFAAAINEADLESRAGFGVTFKAGLVELVSNAGGGYKSVTRDLWTLTAWNGFASTAVGGSSSTSNGYGRLLNQLTVLFYDGRPHLRSTSKDHRYADAYGDTTLYAVGLKRD